jgi:hypothetical protein
MSPNNQNIKSWVHERLHFFPLLAINSCRRKRLVVPRVYSHSRQRKAPKDFQTNKMTQ